MILLVLSDSPMRACLAAELQRRALAVRIAPDWPGATVSHAAEANVVAVFEPGVLPSDGLRWAWGLVRLRANYVDVAGCALVGGDPDLSNVGEEFSTRLHATGAGAAEFGVRTAVIPVGNGSAAEVARLAAAAILCARQEFLVDGLFAAMYRRYAMGDLALAERIWPVARLMARRRLRGWPLAVRTSEALVEEAATEAAAELLIDPTRADDRFADPLGSVIRFAQGWLLALAAAQAGSDALPRRRQDKA